jgi:transposase
MSYRQEVLGRVERRRRFSLEQKVAVLAEACAPGAVISDVARRHGLLPGQVFKWRRLAALGVIGIPGASELPSFVAVEVAAAPAEPPTTASEPVGEGSAKRAVPARTSSAEPRERRPGVIEIELGAGRCVRVVGDVDADALRRVLDVLDGR